MYIYVHTDIQYCTDCTVCDNCDNNYQGSEGFKPIWLFLTLKLVIALK